MIKIINNQKISNFYHLKLFIIILLFIIFKLFKNNKIFTNYKSEVCICTIGKVENLYIREYIEYYKKLGVDKIFIYDNNEINGELFETVLFDFIKINYVNIINYRGFLKPQLMMMNSCYKMNYLKYDWIIFYDIDEFLYLKNYSNIKNFLSDSKFNKCKIIYLNFIVYTDNNYLFYKNESLISRFNERKINRKKYLGKSIIRGNIQGINITSAHYIVRNIPLCNGYGIISKTFIIDSENYYIKHYTFKSTEEYCNKLNRGNVAFDNNYNKKMVKIKMYFAINKITLNKINLLENKTGINLDYFRNRLKNLLKKDNKI